MLDDLLVRWRKFNPKSPGLPRERKLCLLQVELRPGESAVVVGYLRRWSDGPFWVHPGVNGTVTHYADCLPAGLNPQCWPGFCPKEKE